MEQGLEHAIRWCGTYLTTVGDSFLTRDGLVIDRESAATSRVLLCTVAVESVLCAVRGVATAFTACTDAGGQAEAAEALGGAGRRGAVAEELLRLLLGRCRSLAGSANSPQTRGSVHAPSGARDKLVHRIDDSGDATGEIDKD